jgi:hypothetical protein
MTKMTELEEIVWAECVGRLAPPDRKTQEHWESDRFSMHQEHFRIRPLSVQHEELCRAAIAEWNNTEQITLNRLAMIQVEFDTRFPVLERIFEQA